MLKKKKRHFLRPSFVVSSIENTTCKILSELTLSIEIHLRDQNTDLRSAFQVSTDMLACQRLSIEWLSNDCRKTKTKAIIPTNHNRNEQRDEPITFPSNHL